MSRGAVRVADSGRLRRLWFVEPGGAANLQTEAVISEAGPGPVAVDLAASLRRTPYLRSMARRLGTAGARRVLLLGLGGGVLPMALRASGAADVAVVEHSAMVVDLAQRFFGVPQSGQPGGLEIHVADAEELVMSRVLGRERFDGCVIDLFEGHSWRLPAFVLTPEFHRALRASLLPGARVLQNALAHSGYVESAAPSRWAGRRPRGAATRCHVWRRGAAPRGPLWPAAFSQDNEAAEQLRELTAAFRQVYGNLLVHRPCSWSPSRVLEADAH